MTRPHHIRPRRTLLLLASVAALGLGACADDSTSTRSEAGRTAGTAPTPATTRTAVPLEGGRAPRPPGPATLGAADGALPDGTTPFDTTLPGVTRMRPALLAALREAATEARADGVTVQVNSGWRSAAYQQHLLDEAVATHGSLRAAERWVATPGTSEHVSGDAVDVAGTGAAAWLSRRGAAHGLCRVYDNEPWHFELRPDAVAHGCPRRYADPNEDPRMAG